MEHSNADCECLFPAVSKNKTDFRPSLSTAALSSIVSFSHTTMISAHSQVFIHSYCASSRRSAPNTSTVKKSSLKVRKMQVKRFY